MICLVLLKEHRVKPRRFNQVPIDEVILGHTNNAEFEKVDKQ